MVRKLKYIMTKEEKDLVARSNELLIAIESYICSNSNWIYYFLNPLAGGNDELFECMREHPNDWEDYINFEIANISRSLIQIKIHIDDYTDYGLVFSRYFNLLNFDETVKKNKMIYDGKMDDVRRKIIEDDIVSLKDALKKKEEELKKLEKKL